MYTILTVRLNRIKYIHVAVRPVSSFSICAAKVSAVQPISRIFHPAQLELYNHETPTSFHFFLPLVLATTILLSVSMSLTETV